MPGEETATRKKKKDDLLLGEKRGENSAENIFGRGRSKLGKGAKRGRSRDWGEPGFAKKGEEEKGPLTEKFSPQGRKKEKASSFFWGCQDEGKGRRPRTVGLSRKEGSAVPFFRKSTLGGGGKKGGVPILAKTDQEEKKRRSRIYRESERQERTKKRLP